MNSFGDQFRKQLAESNSQLSKQAATAKVEPPPQNSIFLQRNKKLEQDPSKQTKLTDYHDLFASVQKHNDHLGLPTSTKDDPVSSEISFLDRIRNHKAEKSQKGGTPAVIEGSDPNDPRRKSQLLLKTGPLSEAAALAMFSASGPQGANQSPSTIMAQELLQRQNAYRAKMAQLEAEKTKEENDKKAELNRILLEKKIEENKAKEKEDLERRKQEHIAARKKEEQERQIKRALIMKKDERLKLLNEENRVDIGEALRMNHLSVEVLNYKKDYSYFLNKLLTYKYFSVMSVPSEQIPDSFKCARDYTETFTPFFIKETIAGIEQELASLGRSFKNLKVSRWKCEYSSTTNEGFAIYDVESSTADEILHTKNCLVLISLKEEVELKTINRPQNDFFIMGITLDNENFKSKKQIMISETFDSVFKKYHKQASYHVRKLGKITSQIREFLAIKNVEFDFMAEMLYQPKTSQKIFEVRHDYDYFKSFFKNIREVYNSSQFASIQNICLMKQGIKLLQGPPGTGKTHTLIGIVSGLYHYIKNNPTNCRKHILICAPSNYAVDEIITRIVKSGLYDEHGNKVLPKLVRMGVTDKNKNETIKKVTIEYLAEQEVKKQKGSGAKSISGRLLSDLRSELDEIDEKLALLRENKGQEGDEYLKNYEKRGKLVDQIIDKKTQTKEEKAVYETALDKILSEAEIICCTLNSSGSDKMDRYYHNIEAIIVDEAAQCTEPSNIIPLRFRANKLILIGDPKQLPATTFNEQNSFTKFNRSLFERFLDSGLPIEFLDIQYRMVPEIRHFPSDEFYEGRLKDSTDRAARNFPKKLGSLALNNHFFFDLKYGREGQSRFSYFNEEEINFCYELIEALAKAVVSLDPHTIAIITPYKEQMNKIKDMIADSVTISNMVEVNTVDAFQGQEKDIIIFSCVRSRNMHGEKKGIGFLRDTRRLNVALTRAKYCLYVIGNSDVLRSNTVWNNYLYHMHEGHKYKILDSDTEARQVTKDLSLPIRVKTDFLAISKIKEKQEDKDPYSLGKRALSRMIAVPRDIPERPNPMDLEPLPTVEIKKEFSHNESIDKSPGRLSGKSSKKKQIQHNDGKQEKSDSKIHSKSDKKATLRDLIMSKPMLKKKNSEETRTKFDLAKEIEGFNFDMDG